MKVEIRRLLFGVWTSRNIKEAAATTTNVSVSKVLGLKKSKNCSAEKEITRKVEDGNRQTRKCTPGRGIRGRGARTWKRETAHGKSGGEHPEDMHG